ncbi:MAG: hypothetical protein Q4E47_02365 [Candidatus Saccharibacteria bacterium]|nr:hypothetical protein [Candidatus Saccharibacteria bacterium]
MSETAKKNRKLIASLIVLFTIVIGVVVGFVVVKVITANNDSASEVVEKFRLDEKYYNSSDVLKEISEEDFKAKLEAKESFALLVSLPRCTEETAAFKTYVSGYENEKKIAILYMTSDTVRNTMIMDTVKYFPSVILFNKGEIKAYLKFDKDSDTEYYKSQEAFGQWFEKYIEI